MKISEVAKKYGVGENAFGKYVKEHTNYKPSYLGSFSIPDEEVERLVNEYQAMLKDKADAAEQERIEEEEKAKACAEMLITSGFTFDGYRITRYSGYISGDDVTQIKREGVWSSGGLSHELTDALVKIRRQALKELKEAAYDLGCNAVIGVDFDYTTFEPESAALGATVYHPYVICVTANGNAVVIEKE